MTTFDMLALVVVAICIMVSLMRGAINETAAPAARGLGCCLFWLPDCLPYGLLKPF